MTPEQLKAMQARCEAATEMFLSSDTAICNNCGIFLTDLPACIKEIGRLQGLLETCGKHGVTLQAALCAYGTADGDGRTCDCKFVQTGYFTGEQNGCCEARQIIWNAREALEDSPNDT